jgi:hypothetical protein
MFLFAVVDSVAVANVMASDPSTSADPRVYSEGNVFRNMLYTNEGGNLSEIRLADVRGTLGLSFTAEQVKIPPFRDGLDSRHPCVDLNTLLGKCSDKQVPHMLLAARATVCWEERQALQRCLVKNKRWEAPPASETPWWKFWERS